MRKCIPLVPIIILLVSSCTTQMYVSNMENVPLLKEKNEVHIAATSTDLQVAAAVTENLAVMANGFYRESKDDIMKHGGMLGEAALGYFKSLDNNFVVEGFAGAGYGKVYKELEYRNANDEITRGKFDAELMKMFIQPDIGYKGNFFDAALSSRISFVKYLRFNSKDYSATELANDYLDNNQLTGPLFVFAEPAITIGAGYKFVKVRFQHGFTLNATGNKIRHPDRFTYLGIVVNIAKWYQHKDEEPARQD